jgi:hypothetical protein
MDRELTHRGPIRDSFRGSNQALVSLLRSYSQSTYHYQISRPLRSTYGSHNPPTNSCQCYSLPVYSSEPAVWGYPRSFYEQL